MCLMLLSDELPYINVPLHTVIKLTPLAYGCAEERIDFGIDAVNTYIPRPLVSVSCLLHSFTLLAITVLAVCPSVHCVKMT